MEPLLLVRTSAWLLAAAAAVGVVMAIYRLGQGRAAPLLASRLHGYLACAGLSLLLFGWARALLPRTAVLATFLLLVAAIGGLTAAHGRRWKWAPSIEALVFVHLTLAVTGYVLLLASSLSPA
jgi:hypothetical protein